MNKILVTGIAVILAISTSAGAEAQKSAIIPFPALTLQKAVETAVEHNSRIKDATEQRNRSIEYKKSAISDFFAKAEANYRYTRMRNAPYVLIGGAQIQTAHDRLNHWDVSLVQPVFTGFALSSQYRIAKNNVEIETCEREQTLIDLVQQVKAAFLNALLAEKIRNVTEEQVSALRGHTEDAKKYYDQGIIPHNDLLKSQVALANALQQQEKAKADVILAISRLNLLMATDMNTERTLAERKIGPVFNFNMDALVKEGLKNRPLLKALRLGLENQASAVTLARSDYYPQISLVGMVEQNGEDWAESNNDFSNPHNAAIAFYAKWTFFEWGKTRFRVSGGLHAKNALAERILEVEDGVRLEIQKAYLDLDVSRNNIQTAEQALEQAEENWRITKLQYDQQVVNSTEVLDARAFLTQADTNYYHALYGCMISLSELERAVGRR
ncbi:MAG: TolC family protein [Desulfobacterales bacterium]|jgi:outer membrane protein TolC|nr:TolC family protein [Desulfobacterales bacterium]